MRAKWKKREQKETQVKRERKKRIVYFVTQSESKSCVINLPPNNKPFSNILALT